MSISNSNKTPFQQEVWEKIPTSLPLEASAPRYRFAMLGVLFSLVLLPLVYFSLFGATFWALWSWSQEFLRLSKVQPFPWGYALSFPFPFLMGGIFLFFLLKPFFRREKPQEKSILLEKDLCPAFFEIVEKCCKACNAPIPREIRLSVEPNAYATIVGWKGLNPEYSLTLGLPLIQCFSTTSFLSVLSHEIGHFSQKAGMFLTSIARYLQYWFLRITYERDAWDQKFDSSIQKFPFFVVFPLFLLKPFLFLARLLLGLLLSVHILLTSHMMRQMEFDADWIEAQMVGAKAFETTLVDLELVTIAFQETIIHLKKSRSEGTLPQDFSWITCEIFEKNTHEERDKTKAQIYQKKSSGLDVHPSDSERIFQLQGADLPALFENPQKASLLFEPILPKLSQQLSSVLYEQLFAELPLENPLQKESQKETLERKATEDEETKALDRFFAGTFLKSRMLFFPEEKSLFGDGKEEKDLSKKLYQQWKAKYQPIKKWTDSYDRLEETIETTIESLVLQRAGLELPPDEKQQTESETTQFLNECLQKQKDLQSKLEPLDNLIMGSLYAFFQTYLKKTDIAEKELREEIQKLLVLYHALQKNAHLFTELPRDFFALAVLEEKEEQATHSNQFFQEQEMILEETIPILEKFLSEIQSLDFPFSRQPSIFSKYFFVTWKDSDDFHETKEKVMDLLESVLALPERCLSRLIALKEKIENKKKR